jgi:hypothetical protein
VAACGAVVRWVKRGHFLGISRRWREVGGPRPDPPYRVTETPAAGGGMVWKG